VVRQIEPLEYYIRDEEKAVEEYAQLAEALSDHGRKDLAHVVFNIMVQEDQHRAKLEQIQEALLGRRRIK